MERPRQEILCNLSHDRLRFEEIARVQVQSSLYYIKL
jgi:hypothetical protein